MRIGSFEIDRRDWKRVLHSEHSAAAHATDSLASGRVFAAGSLQQIPPECLPASPWPEQPITDKTPGCVDI